MILILLWPDQERLIPHCPKGGSTTRIARS